MGVNSMSKALLVCIFGLLSGLYLTQAYAESPSLYTCKGQGVALKFQTVGFPITTLLTLDIGNKRYSANKANIETKKTVMGDVKSITIKMLPDVEIKKASFILPDISLGQVFTGEFIDRVGFKSQLILTTIATPFFPGPFIGVVNKSNYIDLNCKAELVFIPL
jgi:hypothetical protein